MSKLHRLPIKQAVRHLSKVDENMARAIEIVGPPDIELRAFRSPFHSLSRAIVYQQLSGKAASTIYSRVTALLGGYRAFTAKRVLDTSDEAFRSAGLSASKTRAIKDLAYRTSTRKLPGKKSCYDMSNEDLVSRFTEVFGIGVWTVQMFLMFSVCRPDILPATDLGIQKGISRLMNMDKLPSPEELEEICEKWSPHRTVASWYLWRIADLDELP